ncbi:MAG TPA: phosphoribosyltransferase family protein [Gemmatimonadaceae bacterium]|nr:phosphoribosyltransferase family protein [Gemmatimonadaceae bacterium]
MLFVDRHDAGRRLAEVVAARFEGINGLHAIVLGLPRGGVPVAYEVAKMLRAPLDVFVVRKIGLPWQPELAIGAIASGGVRVLDYAATHSHGVTAGELEEAIEREERELERRERRFRGNEPPIEVVGKTVFLVDDGLATGASMLAAVRALRTRNPYRIVVAVPVAAPEACSDLQREADFMICGEMPEPFHAVGVWYHDFNQTTDEEVQALLAASRVEFPNASVGSGA